MKTANEKTKKKLIFLIR